MAQPLGLTTLEPRMDPVIGAFFECLRGPPAYWTAVLERPPRMGVEDWTYGWWHGSRAANDDVLNER